MEPLPIPVSNAAWMATERRSAPRRVHVPHDVADKDGVRGAEAGPEHCGGRYGADPAVTGREERQAADDQREAGKNTRRWPIRSPSGTRNGRVHTTTIPNVVKKISFGTTCFASA